MTLQAFQEVLLRRTLILFSLFPDKMTEEKVYFSFMKDGLHYLLEKHFLTGKLSDLEISITGYLESLCGTYHSTEKYFLIQNKQNLKFVNCNVSATPVCKPLLCDTFTQAGASNNQTHSIYVWSVTG